MKSNKNEKLIILFTSMILLALSISITSVQDLKYTNDINYERQNLQPSVISGPITILVGLLLVFSSIYKRKPE